MINVEQNTCGTCKFYLPSSRTFYRKECGYCANFSVQKPRVSDNKACKLFELDNPARQGAAKPP